MQVILNWIIFFLIYFFIQVFLYRFLKININKLSVVFFIIGISVAVAFYSHSIEMLMNLIIINLMVICFYIIMLGILNKGPSLVIIDLMVNKKISKKKELKNIFLRGPAGKAVEKRLKINISSNFIKVDKGGFIVKKNTEKIIFFYNLIKKIYGLKSDA